MRKTQRFHLCWTRFDKPPDTKIISGQTITIPIRDEKCCIRVEANSSTDAAYVPVYIIDEGTADVELALVTRYSWIHGSRYVLSPVSAKY